MIERIWGPRWFVGECREQGVHQGVVVVGSGDVGHDGDTESEVDVKAHGVPEANPRPAAPK